MGSVPGRWACSSSNFSGLAADSSVDTKVKSIGSRRWKGKRGFQPERLAQGLEVGSIRRIQGIGYGVLEFLGVGTTHGYAVSSLMDTAYWSSE
ncbi:hypothetical protein Tco_0644377 [Tanacetum coccineum]